MNLFGLWSVGWREHEQILDNVFDDYLYSLIGKGFWFEYVFERFICHSCVIGLKCSLQENDFVKNTSKRPYVHFICVCSTSDEFRSAMTRGPPGATSRISFLRHSSSC